MSYTKNPTDPTGIADALTTALSMNAVDTSFSADILAAGSSVTLETGDVVWLSCIVHDRPETPQIDFLTVAIAAKNGAPWIKPNSQPVCSVFWKGVWPENLAALSIDTVRKALLMIAMGEAQPQVPITNPDPPPAAQQQDALPVGDVATSWSIRTAIQAATQLDAALTDVL
ncbi:MAG: hypothetical protein ACTHMK_13645 [Dyella sp.]|uniref:hypothetical protein n=1 Tax=Dyella sp. TaxID=1869338 RepID=UPI003F8215B8